MPEACAKCSKPLEIEVDVDGVEDDDDDLGQIGEGGSAVGPSESQSQTIPDDVHLSCGHHFHWECLIDSYEISKCPHCDSDITSDSTAASNSAPKILVDLHNEGGLQTGIDIFPLLQEESYLRAYPEDAKSRAFLEFCREGDHRAIAELLKSCGRPSEDDEVPSKPADQVLRYQDPIGIMQSGLHAAAANGHREVAWMLLLLASNYPELEFPPLVFQEAAALGVMREDQDGQVDIRSLRDAHGRTAEDVAREAGVIWTGWIGNGRLAI